MGTTEARLYSRLVETETGCWEYTGCRDRSGYGRIWHFDNTIMAHRASWIVHNGPIPDNLFVLHTCDNPPCCKPEHLHLGTADDNTKEMFKRGRYKITRTTKLTEEQVLEIINSLINGGSRVELSERFNVSLGAIDAIKHGRNWRHLHEFI